MESSQNFKEKRRQMVDEQLKSRDITDQRVLEAMTKVPRHKFVPEEIKDSAYEDYPLSIGHNQTISQPYVVGLMCQLLKLKGIEKVLDIGTGSGYQAAVLSHLAKKVVTVEIVPQLAESAKKTLSRLSYDNIEVIIGDGRKGAPNYAPFDGIVAAAAADQIPQEWKNQLKKRGKIVLPLKNRLGQKMVRITKTSDGFKEEPFGRVMFVPLVKE